ncbi:MAG: metal ABC transporter permease [Steroidobacteraceae bacterium]
MFSTFMLHAWIVATMVAVVAGAVGFFVVARRAAFAAHALPLGAFPGAAAAALLGVNELLGLAVFCALGVVAISQLQRAERSEVASALWLALSLAVGTLLLSLSGAYAESLYGLLFGAVLGISTQQLLGVAVLSALALALVALFARPLLLESLSGDLAAAALGRSGRLELVFLGILALSTTMAVPVVGALLVFSLMVGPASAARAFTDQPWRSLGVSVVLAVGTVWAALALSYLTEWPVGFFVGALGAACYVAGRLRGADGVAQAA